MDQRVRAVHMVALLSRSNMGMAPTRASGAALRNAHRRAREHNH